MYEPYNNLYNPYNLHPITQELVVKGLKFIAEHKELTQEELVDGLLELGCNFTFSDLRKQFNDGMGLFTGMAKADVATGASVVINVRDTFYGRSYADDRFMTLDDATSILQFCYL